MPYFLFSLYNTSDVSLILMEGWAALSYIRRPYRWIFKLGAYEEDTSVRRPPREDSALASDYFRSAWSNKSQIYFSQNHFLFISDHVSQMYQMYVLVYLDAFLGVILTSICLIKSNIKMNVSKVRTYHGTCGITIATSSIMDSIMIRSASYSLFETGSYSATAKLPSIYLTNTATHLKFH